MVWGDQRKYGFQKQGYVLLAKLPIPDAVIRSARRARLDRFDWIPIYRRYLVLHIEDLTVYIPGLSGMRLKGAAQWSNDRFVLAPHSDEMEWWVGGVGLVCAALVNSDDIINTLTFS